MKWQVWEELHPCPLPLTLSSPWVQGTAVPGNKGSSDGHHHRREAGRPWGRGPRSTQLLPPTAHCGLSPRVMAMCRHWPPSTAERQSPIWGWAFIRVGINSRGEITLSLLSNESWQLVLSLKCFAWLGTGLFQLEIQISGIYWKIKRSGGHGSFSHRKQKYGRSTCLSPLDGNGVGWPYSWHLPCWSKFRVGLPNLVKIISTGITTDQSNVKTLHQDSLLW